MCTPLGEVFPRSSDEGLFYHRRQSLGAGALWGVICDKNVMFLFVFRSTKIGVYKTRLKDSVFKNLSDELYAASE